MHVFISWSGDRSKRCAETLRDWLPYMNQEIKPFVSSQDISKGERGLNKIASQLQGCRYGIVCITRDNQSAPWINFESGALSRELGEDMLAPFLLDLPVKDLSGPVAQFQATQSSSDDDVWALVKSMNDKCESSVDHERLRKTFVRFWQDLEDELAQIRSTNPASATPERDTSDILNELVSLVRDQSMRIHSLESRISAGRRTSNHYTINEPREVKIHSEKQEEFARARQLSKAIREIIGPKNLIEQQFDESVGVIMQVTWDGFRQAKKHEKGLQDIAADLFVGAVITHPSDEGDVTITLAPF